MPNLIQHANNMGKDLLTNMRTKRIESFHSSMVDAGVNAFTFKTQDEWTIWTVALSELRYDIVMELLTTYRYIPTVRDFHDLIRFNDIDAIIFAKDYFNHSIESITSIGCDLLECESHELPESLKSVFATFPKGCVAVEHVVRYPVGRACINV